MWYSLLIFILINSGLSIGVTRSRLTEGVRQFVASKSEWAGKWISCTMCLGFSTPLLVYPYVYHNFDLYLIPGFMFIGSITAYLMYRISNILQIQ